MTRRPFREPPPSAAWLHHDARTGFEVVFFRPADGGYVLEGCTSAVEDGAAWAVSYALTLDAGWATRHARVSGRSAVGHREVVLVVDGAGHWRVDGDPAPHLDGCLDVDLEASACTNAQPVHRLNLAVGGRAAAPAAWVRATDLSVERLEQDYVRVPDDDLGRQRYDYAAPALDFACRLVVDRSGLVLDYPGIATRAGTAEDS